MLLGTSSLPTLARMNRPDHPSAPPTGRKRVRLAPEVRRQQILDAALIEFSAVGFEGATMERIAQRVGITKAGLYAHFEGKDAVFEALLISNIFGQTDQPHWHWAEGRTLEDVVDGFLDGAYRMAREPKVQATFRLLITESGRTPARTRRWHREIFQPYTEQRQSEMDDCVARGALPDCAATRRYSVLSSPALLAMMSYLILGIDDAEHEVAEIRAAHREMLLTLLRRTEGAQ